MRAIHAAVDGDIINVASGLMTAMWALWGTFAPIMLPRETGQRSESEEDP